MTTLKEELLHFNSTRLPEMVKLKYAAMAENPFRFFRGTCHLFYKLVSQTELPESPLTWTCGDLHLENFGSYRGNDGQVYFDLNDFDEAILAPALWEVVRLLTSIFIAFETLGIGPDKAEKMATLFVRTYSDTLVRGKARSLDPRTADGIVATWLKKAKRSTYRDLIAKRTTAKGHRVLFSLKDERHFRLDKPMRKELMRHIDHWINHSSDGPYNFKTRDVVFRLAGTGSIGVKRYLALIQSTRVRDHFLMIDIKQSFPSSLAPYLEVAQPQWSSESERIVSVQERMENVAPSLMSTMRIDGDTFVVQELQPVKDSIKFKLIRNRYRDIYKVIDDMALLTASSQLRSGGMDGSAIIDELRDFGRLDWQNELVTVARVLAAKYHGFFNEYLELYRSGQMDQRR